MKAHAVWKKAGIVSAALIAIAASLVLYTYVSFRTSIGSIERLDSEGLLYYIDYKGDYYHSPAALLPPIVREVGCSAFTTRLTDRGNGFATCRNYDFPHYGKDGGITGLNAVLRLYPKGKYASINLSDVTWLSLLWDGFKKGALDDGSSPAYLTALLPWICMDGINEKGLCVSILALDVKEGETAAAQQVHGRKTVYICELLRLLLDNCADVREAVEYAGNVNMHGLAGNDYHLLVTDAQGNSRVFEWRYNELYVTGTDAVTNCYVAFDDAADCYKSGILYERAPAKADSLRAYRMGYGHGYARYNAIIAALDTHRDSEAGYTSAMTAAEAEDILRSVWQDCDRAGGSSQTQYSVIYENEQRRATVLLMTEPERKFEFTVGKGAE